MDEFDYSEFNLMDDQHINNHASMVKPTLNNHAHSVNGPAMHMTIKAQLKYLKDKYDTLEQKAKTFQLENREYSSEINKLHKENEELQIENKLLSEQHTEIYDNKKSMANILSTKSLVLDKQQITIETLQYEIIKQQESIKTLTTQNNNLITENKNYKNYLEENVIKNNLYFKEKEQYNKQIELLTQNIHELQHQIHDNMFAILPDEEKSMEQSASNRRHSNSQSTDVLGKAKTVRFELSFTSRHSSYDDGYDEHSHNKKYTGRRYSAKSIMSAASGTSYMGVNEFRDKSHNNIFCDQLKPLVDSPQTSVVSGDVKNINIHLTQSHTDEVGVNYNINANNLSYQSIPLGYDAASMHFDGKLIELLNEQQNHINDLNDKYNELNDKYEILENDYKEQKLKLSKRGKTIKELRAKNDDLSKKLASSKSCIVFDWFN
eukprot:5545_1